MKTTTRTQSQLLYRRSYKPARRTPTSAAPKANFKVVLGPGRPGK